MFSLKKNIFLVLAMGIFTVGLSAKRLHVEVEKLNKVMIQKVNDQTTPQAKIDAVTTYIGFLKNLFQSNYRDLSSMRNYSISQKIFSNYLFSKIQDIRRFSQQNRNLRYSEEFLFKLLRELERTLQNHRYCRIQDVEAVRNFIIRLENQNILVQLNQTRRRRRREEMPPQPEIRERVVYRDRIVQGPPEVVYIEQPPQIIREPEIQERVVYRDREIQGPPVIQRQLVDVDPRILQLLQNVLHLDNQAENLQQGNVQRMAQIQRMLLNNQGDLIRGLQIRQAAAQQNLQRQQILERRIDQEIRQPAENIMQQARNNLLNNNNN